MKVVQYNTESCLIHYSLLFGVATQRKKGVQGFESPQGGYTALSVIIFQTGAAGEFIIGAL